MLPSVYAEFTLTGYESKGEVAIIVLTHALKGYEMGHFKDGNLLAISVEDDLYQEFTSEYDLALCLGKGIKLRDKFNERTMSDVDSLINLAVQCRWPLVTNKKHFKGDHKQIVADCKSWANQYLSVAKRVAEGDVTFSTLPQMVSLNLQ